MSVITVTAENKNLSIVNEFIEQCLSGKCSDKTLMEIYLIVEELFVNVSNYAYKDSVGSVDVECNIEEENVATITITDSGTPFNPLKQATPDINAPAEDRKIGGLGIFLSKKLSDNIEYRYCDNKNIITFKKNLK